MTIPGYSVGTEGGFYLESGVVCDADLSSGGVLVLQTGHIGYGLLPTSVTWRPVTDESPLTLGDPITPDNALNVWNHSESPTGLCVHVAYFEGGHGGIGKFYAYFDGDVASGSYRAILCDASACQIESDTEQYGTAITNPEATFETVQNLVLRVGIDHIGNPDTPRDLIRVDHDTGEDSERPNTAPTVSDVFTVESNRSVAGLTLVFSVIEQGALGGVDLYLDPLDMGPATPQSIAPAAAVSGPVAYGPLIARPGDVVPDLVATVYRLPNLNDPVVVLDQSKNKRFQDLLNRPGSGSVVVANDDPDLALVEFGDLVRFTVKGYAALTALIDDWSTVTIAEGEEAVELTTLSGPGHLALLGEAIVYPARGVRQLPIEEDRVFNWSAVDYDDAAWIYATSIATQASATTYWHDADANPLPVGWPDPGSEWIWASSGTQEWAPAGTCYFRKTFTVPGDVSRLVIYLTCDDSAALYLDGQKMLDTDNQANDPTEIRTVYVDVTPGDHVLAVQATNAPDPEGDEIHNPAGLLVAAFPVDTTGSLTSASPTVATDSSWFIVEYPPHPPGMTAGEVLRHVIEEAQARDALLGVRLMFDDEVDSDGTPWPEVTDIATKVGTDVLTFVQEVVDSYVDVWIGPAGLDLYAWVRDGRGETKAVALYAPTDDTDPNSGNLANLTHHTVQSPGDALLVRWANGWEERTDDAVIAAGRRREALLTLGAAQSRPEAIRVADRQLERFSDSRTEIAAEAAPVDDTDTPYLAYLVGDRITVPDRNGDPVVERVVACTVSEDEDGNLSFSPELKDTILAEWERWEQGLKKMTDGTLGGRSVVATPVSPTTFPSPDCCPPSAPAGGGGGG